MRALVVIAALAACKDQQHDATPAPTPTKSPATPTVTPRPSLPDEPKRGDQPPEPVTIEEATAILPKIEGAEILPLKQTSDKRQVHGTWCIDGDSAEGVARTMGRWMAEADFAALSIRGDARKAGVSGDRNGFRLSMVVSASSAAKCPAPKSYFSSATIFRP